MNSSYRSPKVEVRNSSRISGQGLFAKEKISKGELVAIKNGSIFSKKGFLGLPQKCKEYCLQINDNFFIGPATEEDIVNSAVCTNHSCDPNIAFCGDVVAVAIRDIEKDEEITHDYATSFTYLEHFENMKCNCGSKDCRGRIMGNDWKSKKLQKKYGNNFSTYILRKFDV
jgi:hypothetical protein